MSYRDFTKMPVWNVAIQAVVAVYQITEALPKREDYALCGQLRNAAMSITGNIAEGFGRGHAKDKINFYLFSRGSASEVKGHLIAGVAVGYFTEEQIAPIRQTLSQVMEELNKIIKFLKGM